MFPRPSCSKTSNINCIAYSNVSGGGQPRGLVWPGTPDSVNEVTRASTSKVRTFTANSSSPLRGSLHYTCRVPTLIIRSPFTDRTVLSHLICNVMKIQSLAKNIYGKPPKYQVWTQIVIVIMGCLSVCLSDGPTFRVSKYALMFCLEIAL